MSDVTERAFALLCKKYVQRSDERQAAMGLQYTEAETHDLAKTIAAFATAMHEASPVQEGDLADEVRAIAEDSNYSNEMIGIAVRNWFHRNALASPIKDEVR